MLNKTFEGLKGNAEFGDTDKDDHRVYKMELTAGTSFAGDRGHLILSAQHTMSPDAVFINQRSWWKPEGLFPATPGAASCGGGTVASPECIRTYINGGTANTIGGLITSSAAGVGTVGVNGVTALASANALKGLQFGPNGTISQFQFGTVYASTCTNCSATNFSSNSQFYVAAVPVHNTTLFG